MIFESVSITFKVATSFNICQQFCLLIYYPPVPPAIKVLKQLPGFMKLLYFFVLTLWFSVSIAGAVYLARYKNTAAEETNVYPKVFPEASSIQRNATLPTLIFFVHPKCPCTRASLHELNRLMTDINGKLKIHFVFIKPPETDETWTQTDLRASAETVPDARILIDEGGRETEIFNARTSGLILLYDRNGNLRYDGGITSSRGHEGDNSGRAAIYQIISQDSNLPAEMPVFGCPLREKDCQGEKMEYVR